MKRQILAGVLGIFGLVSLGGAVFDENKILYICVALILLFYVLVLESPRLTDSFRKTRETTKEKVRST